MSNTTTTATSYASSGYDLRELTQKIHELNLSRTPVKYRTSRKVLPPQQTASRIREDGHDCDLLETDHTVNKVATRLFHSLFRFSLAHAFNCKTRRGHTHLNGAQSKCGGCEAAHSALSPTLYDNILEIICTELDTKPFDKLEISQQKYLTTRFKLKPDEIKTISSEKQSDRTLALTTIVSRLTAHEKKGSLVGTATERARNATYDNPRDSNRFDSHLEHHLKPEEDHLAEECRLETKTPVEALGSLQNKYRDLVETAVVNLGEDLKLLDHLQDAWNTLLDCQSKLQSLSTDAEDYAKEFGYYIELADIYLVAHKHFFNRKAGTPNLKNFQKFLVDNQSKHTLVTVQGEKDPIKFQTYTRFLKIPTDSKEQFDKAKRSIERRLHEAQNQRLVLEQKPSDMKLMVKHLFGTVNSDGVLVTPDKDTVAAKITDLMQSSTPMHSSRNQDKTLTLQDSEK